MYIDGAEIEEQMSKAKKTIIGWGIAFAIFLFAIFGQLSETDEELKSSMDIIPTSLVCMAICSVFIILAVLKISKLNMAKQLNTAFTNDNDGVMTFKEIANSVRSNEKTVERNITWLMKKNLLIHCRFDDKNRNRLLLTDVAKKETNEFFTKNCPNCGTFIQARPGATLNCPACGTPIKTF